ncbi:MAG TPA: ROK family transcriptional regulator [Microbacterium sp.]|uniref:ROK family transcriptional regulator n=1 Tax=Microbacterium sp. TaxID=51671 RepID=UPI002B47D0C8|nr:ROK family transcriptional regulator [Microbacterium sp.]HKT56789.1 ROK family transcriptional regulator [Microbacterium sp.]
MSAQRRTPGSQASLREANRQRIIDAVKKHGGLTQVELATVTGLSPATVSNIVRELSAGGVVNTSQSIRSGRRAQHVTIAHAVGLVAGVHFAARHMRIAVGDVSATIVAENHMPLARDHRADNEMDRVTILLADMLDSLDAGLPDLIALGISIPAPIDTATGVIARPGIMRGWDGLPIAETMERRIQRPVFADNAANLSALAEHRLGAARGKEDSVFVEVDDGVGAGIVIGGHLYRGGSGTAGELGHTVIRENGPLCRCGNRGCLEAVASGRSLLRDLAEVHGALKLNDIVVKAMSGDDACVRALGDAGQSLGIAIANLCNILAPDRVVVGGEVGRAGEMLLGPIRRELERSVLTTPGSLPELVPGQLGRRASVMGAILNAAERAQA